ncbi:hypothetical protein K449DRAFT_400239 [Hypoxylon sp. EC38]|nr:hypothetical protein K449DRAFT_400239 [Hypoxylon sp. EC38]
MPKSALNATLPSLACHLRCSLYVHLAWVGQFSVKQARASSCVDGSYLGNILDVFNAVSNETEEGSEYDQITDASTDFDRQYLKTLLVNISCLQPHSKLAEINTGKLVSARVPVGARPVDHSQPIARPKS